MIDKKNVTRNDENVQNREGQPYGGLPTYFDSNARFHLSLLGTWLKVLNSDMRLSPYG